MWGLIPDRLKGLGKNKFTQKLFEHLKDREGFKQSVYLDTLGKATCGIGHLLTEEEKEKYPVKCLVPKHVINKWFESMMKQYRRYCIKIHQIKNLLVG